MSVIKYRENELIYENSDKYGKLFANNIVALGYGIDSRVVRLHKDNNSDELIEGIHWIKDFADTKGGRQKVIKWTSLGVYHLGFFIKSKEAKTFRKFMANVANVIDPYKINRKNQLQKENIELRNTLKILLTNDSDENERLKEQNLKYYEELSKTKMKLQKIKNIL